MHNNVATCARRFLFAQVVTAAADGDDGDASEQASAPLLASAASDLAADSTANGGGGGGSSSSNNSSSAVGASTASGTTSVFPFRAWLLASLMQACDAAVRLERQEPGASSLTAPHEMLHLIFLAERLLYFDPRDDHGGETQDEVHGVARLVLSNTTLEFAKTMGVE